MRRGQSATGTVAEKGWGSYRDVLESQVRQACGWGLEGYQDGDWSGWVLLELVLYRTSELDQWEDWWQALMLCRFPPGSIGKGTHRQAWGCGGDLLLVT